jgi:large subunit ribosomal protein L31e
MAKKKVSETSERNYVIPIRRATLKTARWRRAKKAISTIRAFIKRHMKVENIKIGKELNELIWERGGKKVPSKVSVLAEKDGDTANVNLVGIEKSQHKKTEKTKGKDTDKKEPENKKEIDKSNAEKVEETDKEGKKEEKSE